MEKSGSDPIRRSFETWWTLVVYAGLAALVWFATEDSGIPLQLFERGHWLGPASDMLAGKVPYRDTFPVHGFLADGGLDYLLFRVFGESFRVSVLAHHSLESLFQPALFLVAAAATRLPWLAALAIPLNIGFATGIHFERPVVALASLALFLLGIDTRRRPYLMFLAGLMGAVGLLYSLEFGTFVLLAELGTLVIARAAATRETRLLPTVWFLGGAAAALLPFLLLLAALGAIGPFLQVSFWDLPKHIHSVWGLHFPTPWQIVGAWLRGTNDFVGDATLAPGLAKRLYLSPVMGALGIGLAVLLWRKGARPAALRMLALSFACALFFRYVIARLHLEHGNALTGPLFLLILVGVRDLALASGATKWARPAVFAIVGVLGALAMNGPSRTWMLVRSAAHGIRPSVREDLVSLTAPRGAAVQVPRKEAVYVEGMVRFIEERTPPGSQILDLSNEPALYYFLRRTNPTRFYQVPMMTPFQSEVLRDLKRSPPAAVILETGSDLDRLDGIPNPVRIPDVWKYVSGAYPFRERVGGTLIALRAGSLIASAGRERRP